MTAVSRRFGATQALDGVSLELRAGEVRALIGENGAGKSTLMKVLSGVHAADGGTMRVAGETYAPRGPADARAAGIAMIYQELNLAPHLSVEANILLGQERSRLGLVRRGEHRELSRRTLARLGVGDLPLERPVGALPIAVQQLVEIARALAQDARVLVFDEPTSSLTEDDARRLFTVIGELRAAGLGVVYISHFLEELAQVADRYTVLRDGRAVQHGELSQTPLDEIVRLMVGRDLTEMFPQVPHAPGDVRLTVRGLTGRPAPLAVNFDLRRGEIFGLAGLVGAGRSELVRCLYGLLARSAGTALLTGGAAVGRSPRRSIRAGLGLVSENRKEEGLALNLSIVDNLTLTRLRPYARAGALALGARRRAARHWMQRMACRAEGPEQPVGQLSGGNQQKIAMARLLHQQADVYLLDEPTRGIDIGAKAEIYRLMGQLAADGHSVVMVSSYLPELLHVCDRIGVMCRGSLREVRDAAQWTEDEIMHVATGRAATTLGAAG